MAHRPLPHEVKKAKGTLRKNREAKTPPPRVTGIPAAPKSLTKFAREAYDDFAKLLMQRGQLTQDSLPALIRLCKCAAELRELEADLARNGRFQTVTTGTGAEMERARPALAAFQDAERRYRAWLIEFGLTDASRGKVNVDPALLPKPPADEEKAPAAVDRSRDPLAPYGLN